MNNLQQDFLLGSISDLEILSANLEGENLREEFLREVFRKIHTIKGTAQTFGFVNSARLAHELENGILDAVKHDLEKQSPASQPAKNAEQETIENINEKSHVSSRWFFRAPQRFDE